MSRFLFHGDIYKKRMLMDSILEYYKGNPDAIDEIDDNSGKVKGYWKCNESEGISFGWFQTTLDGEKKFVMKKNKMHYEIADEIALKIVGKAMADSRITTDDVDNISFLIDSQAFFKGRVFTQPKVISTWYKVPSSKLAEILGLLGGVENFKDYMYVCDKSFDSWEKRMIMGKSINVIEYINSNERYVSPYDELGMSKNIIKSLNPKIVETIEICNAPNSKLADKTAKLGNMTIAQYNSLIHQEEKEPKNIIKEYNMKENKYQKEFSNYIEIMNESLKMGDFKAYNLAKSMLDESISDYEHEKSLIKEMDTNNFGILNHIFEQELPSLLKNNKKAVKNVIRTIKEDKNLLGEFNFYNTVKNRYKGNLANIMEASEMLEKLVETSLNEIDQESVKESNKKFRNVLKENHVVPSEFVDDELKKLYESCHIILTKKKSVANMPPIMESYHSVCEYMDKHKNDAVRDGKSIDEMIDTFENKLKNNLNESEISFVQQITDFRTPIAEQRKEKLFNKLKEDCVTAITSMLKEDKDNVELQSLNKQLSEMKFNNESIVGDIAKLLEIRDILLDK